MRRWGRLSRDVRSPHQIHPLCSLGEVLPGGGTGCFSLSLSIVLRTHSSCRSVHRALLSPFQDILPGPHWPPCVRHRDMFACSWCASNLCSLNARLMAPSPLHLTSPSTSLSLSLSLSTCHSKPSGAAVTNSYLVKLLLFSPVFCQIPTRTSDTQRSWKRLKSWHTERYEKEKKVSQSATRCITSSRTIWRPLSHLLALLEPLRGASLQGHCCPLRLDLFPVLPTLPEAGRNRLYAELFDVLCRNAMEGASDLSILKTPRGRKIHPGVAVGRG